MAKVEVIMPQLGESLTEGTIVKWHKKLGEKVKKDEILLEISTDKVDSEIPSPATGVVTKILVEEQKTVAVRTVVAEIDTEGAALAGPPAPAPNEQKAQPAPVPPPFPQAPASGKRQPEGGRFYSPLVLNIARTEGIPLQELEQLPGTGEGGRVTKKDILAYAEARKRTSGVAPAEIPVAPAPVKGSAPRVDATLRHVESGDLAAKYPPPGYEILQMSNIIMKMSEHMVRSVRTSPHVQAVHEVDMSRVELARQRNAELFERREGFKLTYTPFVCHAVIKALKKFPLINSSVDGDKIILKKFVNLGIAVATDGGLIVPVIKNAEEKNFVGLARGVNDIAQRARTRRLTPADIEGGTFTITNYGVFGTLIGVPIINQPQVAILGTGAIRKRPVVIDDGIAIRSIAYFTLSFDHRIVDGALGGEFLQTLVNNLETFDDKAVL